MPGNIKVKEVWPYGVDADYTPRSLFSRGVGASVKPLKNVKFTTALDLGVANRMGDCENFEVSEGDKNYKSVDGMIYTKDGKTLVRIPLGRKKVIRPLSSPIRKKSVPTATQAWNPPTS